MANNNREGFNMPLIVEDFRRDIWASDCGPLDEGRYIIVNPADFSKQEIEQVRSYFRAHPEAGKNFPIVLGKWILGYASWESMGPDFAYDEDTVLPQIVRWAGFGLYPQIYYDFEDVEKWASLDGMLKAIAK